MEQQQKVMLQLRQELEDEKARCGGSFLFRSCSLYNLIMTSICVFAAEVERNVTLANEREGFRREAQDLQRALDRARQSGKDDQELENSDAALQVAKEDAHKFSIDLSGKTFASIFRLFDVAHR